MNILWLILGILSFVASGVMLVVGSTSSHLSELADVFFAPIPLGILFIVLFIVTTIKKKKRKQAQA